MCYVPADQQDKGRKNKAASSPKERKSRKPTREKREDRENPLHERTRSADNKDKRKTRRDFFNEKNENAPRSSQRRANAGDNRRANHRSTDRDDRRKPFDRSSSDRFDREDSRGGFRDKERKPFRNRDDRRKPFDRNSSDRFDREDSRGGFRDKERKPFRDRDDRRDDRKAFRNRWDDRGDNRRNYDEKPKRERRSTALDSDIMREIIQKRRSTGRSSQKQKVLSLAWSEERGPIRLNKYISNSGICSRREADQLIIAGAVTVNGEIVTELGAKVMPTDEVRYEDKVLQREKPVYILLNKPKDFITTTEDDRDRNNVMMLIEGACPERVYPVGRLDRNSTGLLLFTNDGEMAKKLTHPKYDIKKIYQVELDRNVTLADFETLANGVELNDGFIKPDEIAFVEGQKHVIGITLHSGKNRVVRRMFDHLGYEVEKLDRVYYAGLTKKDLPRGEWRFLRQDEINILKMSL